MSWFIWLLTFVLVVDCLFLILLVLIQLPKKEAGIGQAFGGTATDALFGAGSGTALTKMTKYATGVFFGLTFLLAILNAQQSKNRTKGFEEQLRNVAKEVDASAPVAAKPPPATGTNLAAAAAPGGTNLLLTTTTNAAAKPATNAPATPPANKAK